MLIIWHGQGWCISASVPYRAADGSDDRATAAARTAVAGYYNHINMKLLVILWGTAAPQNPLPTQKLMSISFPIRFPIEKPISHELFGGGAGGR